MRPIKGQVYTARQILKDLELEDSPSFNFYHDGRRGTIQHSHITNEQLLSVPGFKDSQWRYRFTTAEWIPVFECESDPLDFLYMETYKDFDGTPTNFWWAVPRGFPREQ